ncbi:S41 family peptidase [Empedobacter falsenii]
MKYYIYLLFFLSFQNLLLSQSNDFYKEYISILKENSINKKEIDWKNFEKTFYEKAKISKDSAIEYSLKIINNRHSSYHTKEGKAFYSSIKPYFELGDSIGVNFIGGYSNPIDKTLYKSKGEEYINKIQNSILKQLNNNPKYWIIDLRSNTGGNMWPMLTALLPFYENGDIGYFENQSSFIPWTKKDGYIFSGNFNQSKNFIDSPINYNLNLKYIFVLISERTSSSGEAVAISLKGLNNVILIGSESGGFTTGNATYELSNGDVLVLTGNYMVDKNKKRYLPSIKPDYEMFKTSDIENFILKFIEDNYKK